MSKIYKKFNLKDKKERIVYGIVILLYCSFYMNIDVEMKGGVCITELKLRIRDIYNYESTQRRKTIFLEENMISICSPWKWIPEEQKIKKIQEYIISKKLPYKITNKTIDDFTLKNLKYQKDTGKIVNMNIIPKNLTNNKFDKSLTVKFEKLTM